MGNQSIDTKLARRLQKRNVYPNYSACLSVVRDYLVKTDLRPKEVQSKIDAGDLDPK